MKEPKPLYSKPAETLRLREVFMEWVYLPLAIVAVLHVAIWLVCSFVVWDLGWLSWFSHRVLFTALALFVWGALINDALSDDE